MKRAADTPADGASAAKKPALVQGLSHTMNNGLKIPGVALGTAFRKDDDRGNTVFTPEQAYTVVPEAIRQGYRHFDTSHMYQSEPVLGNIFGRLFMDGVVTRDELFITSKVMHWRCDGSPHLTFNLRDVPDITAQTKQSAYESLGKLGMGYFDLLLLHWPGTPGETDVKFAQDARMKMWRGMEELYDKGFARAIGVSNFTKEHLEPMLKECKIVPMVNQIEVHPLCQDRALETFSKENGIILAGYAPIAAAKFGLLKNPVLVAIAQRLGKSTAQVCLRWGLQLGNIILPMSSKPKRMAENIDLFDWELTEEDMAAITGLQGPGEKPQRTCEDPYIII